jgi:hypothetical protein
MLSDKHIRILEQVDKLYVYNDTNPYCQNIHALIENINNTRRYLFEILKTEDYSAVGKTNAEIHEELNQLTDRRKEIQEGYEKHLLEKFPFIGNRFRFIIERVVDGVSIDKNTLQDVIHKFAMFQNGEINEAQAINKGTRFTAQKYGIDENVIIHLNENETQPQD